MSVIHPVVMPSWGLSMEEGTIIHWHKAQGDRIAEGEDLVDIETTKITNTLEAQATGTLHRALADVGDVLPCGRLIGVIAPDEVGQDELAAFIATHREETGSAAPGEAEAMPSAEPHTIEVNTRPFRYLSMGAGDEPVVFLHGFGADLEAWMFNQPAIAEARAAYAIDLPGHGGSTKAVADGAPEALATEIRAVLETLGLERMHLVGHSLGAAVAALVALGSPAKIASLTLIAPVGMGDAIDIAFLDGFVAAVRRKELKSVLQRLVADENAISRDMVEAVVRYKRIDGVAEALAAIRHGFADSTGQTVSLREQIGALGVPVLAIWGAEDRIIPVDQAEGLEALGIKSHILPGVGHMPHMEAASDVNAAIAEFLADNN